METKQVIVMRKDLNMRKGKMVAQGSHASMAVILDELDIKQAIRKDDCDPIFASEAIAHWLNNSFTKVCVSVNSEEALLGIYNKAKEANICCSLIQDSGRTEFGGVPTYTCVGIGPAEVAEVDKITGSLPLL